MDCIVCTEHCETTLQCTHRVHTLCIARAGQHNCPVCRIDISEELTPEDHIIRLRAVAEIRRENERENRNAAIQIARQIHQNNDDEEDNRPPQPRRHRIRDTQITISPFVNLSQDQLMTELFTLTQSIDTRQPEVTVSTGTYRFYEHISSIRELSLEIGLEMNQMIDVLQLAITQ
jgi:hypothetical protein